jgi:hypothetical protein
MKVQSKGSSRASGSTKRDQLGPSKGQKGPFGLNLGGSSSSKVEPSHSGILLIRAGRNNFILALNPLYYTAHC